MAPPVVCLGGIITFTLEGVTDSGGLKRFECAKQAIPPGPLHYSWLIVKPDGTVLGGQGSVATVTANLPGTYQCTFSAAALRDCPPPPLVIGPATATIQTTATLTLNPSFISAKTSWSDMPPNLSQSDITVTWNPPECVGRLAIVQLDPTGGYMPLGQGVLTKQDDTHWRYVAFDEPPTELCAKDVKVWIAAFQGDVELTRKSILVLPVHTYFVTGAGANFSMDLDYIRWKYSAVLAATGGAFTTIITSPNACVTCPPLIGPCVYACTICDPTFDCMVVFATDTFSGTENQAASIIGHELIHTVFILEGECPAYQWEVDHSQQTGIFHCDTPYLQTVLQYLANPINECP